MKLDVSHSIAADAATVAARLADPEFLLARPDRPPLGEPELLVHDVSGSRVHLEIRYRFTGDLNAAARSFLEPDKLTWIQVSDHDLEGLRVVFHLRPDHYANRLTAKGRYLLVPDGSNSCRRQLQADLRVKVPLVGGQVERVLIDGLRTELDHQANDLMA